jgi:hypothetical protein
MYPMSHEVLKTMTLKNTVSWDVLPCSLAEYRSFMGMHWLQLQDQMSKRTTSKRQVECETLGPKEACFLLTSPLLALISLLLAPAPAYIPNFPLILLVCLL